MDFLMTFIGVAIMVLGAAIWRFNWIRLLSNVDINAVDEIKKEALARFAGGFVLLVGGLITLLAYLTERLTTERELLLLIGCAVVIIFILTGIYLTVDLNPVIDGVT